MPLEWKTSWTSSQLGPYPTGSVLMQTDLSHAFPDPDRGAVDQTFRMIVRPDIWSGEARVRFSNVWGARPLTLDGAFVGLHLGSSAVAAGTNAPLAFGGSRRVVVQPGETAWSDGVRLPFVEKHGREILAGRRLALSFHIVGESGPMTWHASAMTSSYVSWPNAGSHGSEEGEFSFPFSVNSWFFVDALDMMADASTRVAVCFGDSITDGSSSTLNGEDRWPDILSRALHAKYGDAVSVVNAGIGANQVAGPAECTVDHPYRGGPAAVHRFERDILSLSGVSSVVWLEGINDFQVRERSMEDVRDAMIAVVGRLRELRPGIRVIGATLPSALGANIPEHGNRRQDEKRRALNAFIRNGGLFDAHVDFDAAVTDPATGRLRDEFVPNSTRGGEGDFLHPNRPGKLKMVEAFDLGMF